MPETRQRLESIFRERIAVLDGSWGVLIQRELRGEEAYRGERFRDHSHDVAGDPDLLNLTRPEVVARIHDDYFEAGADIATTNTFTATTIGQADYALGADVVREMNLEGARLARRAADDWTASTPDKPRFVAGAVGPLNVTLSLSPQRRRPGVPRGHVRRGARRVRASRSRALREGGVDLLLIETVFDTLNAKAAIAAAHDAAPELPLWLSFTAIDKSGRNLSGQTVEAFWISVEHAQPLIVGVNCSLGAAEMRPVRRGPRGHRADVGRLLPERRPAERVRPARRAAATTRAGCSASSRATASSTSSAAAAARRPSTSARSPPRSRASRRAPFPSRRRVHALQRPRAVRDHARTRTS